MTFRELQNKVRWVALASGVFLVALQWWKIQVYPKWNGVYPAPELDLLVLLLVPITFLLGLFSIPRWQSWLALLCSAWAVFVMWFVLIQGHEP